MVFNTFLTNPIVRGDFEIDGSSTIEITEDNGSLDYALRAQINGDQAHIYGASFQLKVNFSSRSGLFGTVSFSDGKESSTNEPLRHTTPFFGKIAYKYSGEKFTSEIFLDFNGHRWRSAIPRTEIDDKPYLYTDDGSPGWYTINYKASYELNENLYINGGVENILDAHYRPYSSGISAPGRNFILALRASF